jgi:hypothetical protein
MPDQAQYRVREAVLIKTETGSAWKVTFALVDDEASDEIEIWVLPDRVDAMSFAARYTVDEIEAFRDARGGQ